MTETAAPRPRRKPLTKLLLLSGLLALAGLAALALTVLSWTDWERASPAEAEAALAEARAALGGGPAYAEIGADGELLLHREQEPAAPSEVARLRALVWSSEKGRLVRVRMPAWFLTMKSSATFGVDRFLDEIAGGLGARVRLSMDDLRARGPGLYFDHAFPGGRVLVWGEAP